MITCRRAFRCDGLIKFYNYVRDDIFKIFCRDGAEKQIFREE